MSFETISRKDLNELELRVRELLVIMKKTKLQDDPRINALKSLEQELGDVRRKRFDEANPEFQGY